MEHTFTIHLAVSIASAGICLLLGVLMLDLRILRPYIKHFRVRPQRYIAARRALGVAFLLIGGVTVAQIVFHLPQKHEEWLTFIALFVSSSQVLLFTAALLALLNSRKLTLRRILLHASPLAVFALCGFFLPEGGELRDFARLAFLGFYVFQLIHYTGIFIGEWLEYRNQILCYFGEEGRATDIYKQNKVVALFICSLLTGIVAFCSYFFTEQWHETVFTIGYTLYYVAVAMYFINYALMSEKVTEITTSEEWEKRAVS